MTRNSEHAALCFEDVYDSGETDIESDTYSWLDEIEEKYRHIKETEVPSLPGRTRGFARFSRRWVPRVVLRLSLLSNLSWAERLDRPTILTQIENALPAAGPDVPFDDIGMDD